MLLRSGLSIKNKGIVCDSLELGALLYANKMTTGDLSMFTNIPSEKLDNVIANRDTLTLKEILVVEDVLGGSIRKDSKSLKCRRGA